MLGLGAGRRVDEGVRAMEEVSEREKESICPTHHLDVSFPTV
jgi:hypothetical protein